MHIWSKIVGVNLEKTGLATCPRCAVLLVDIKLSLIYKIKRAKCEKVYLEVVWETDNFKISLNMW